MSSLHRIHRPAALATAIDVAVAIFYIEEAVCTVAVSGGGLDCIGDDLRDIVESARRIAGVALTAAVAPPSEEETATG